MRQERDLAGDARDPAQAAGRVTHGEVIVRGRRSAEGPGLAIRQVRGNDIAMIFQDPMTSLNPVLTVGRQITEALRKHMDMNKDEANKEAISFSTASGSPPQRTGSRIILISSPVGCDRG